MTIETANDSRDDRDCVPDFEQAGWPLQAQLQSCSASATGVCTERCATNALPETAQLDDFK